MENSVHYYPLNRPEKKKTLFVPSHRRKVVIELKRNKEYMVKICLGDNCTSWQKIETRDKGLYQVQFESISYSDRIS